MFLLGTVANTHGDARWIFAAGAMAASVIWFFGLAFGARYLGRWLGTPRAWRILDAVIAVVMIVHGREPRPARTDRAAGQPSI